MRVASNLQKLLSAHKVLNPPQKRSVDILSEIDQVNSKLADNIKLAESTLQNKG